MLALLRVGESFQSRSRLLLSESLHSLYAQSNTRFEAARTETLLSLPDNAPDSVREVALAEFYRSWVLQETPRQAAYTREFRRRTLEEIRLSLRAHWTHLKRILAIAPSPPTNQF